MRGCAFGRTSPSWPTSSRRSTAAHDSALVASSPLRTQMGLANALRVRLPSGRAQVDEVSVRSPMISTGRPVVRAIVRALGASGR